MVPDGARGPSLIPRSLIKENPACGVEKDETVSSEVEGELQVVRCWKPRGERASRRGSDQF